MDYGNGIVILKLTGKAGFKKKINGEKHVTYLKGVRAICLREKIDIYNTQYLRIVGVYDEVKETEKQAYQEHLESLIKKSPNDALPKSVGYRWGMPCNPKNDHNKVRPPLTSQIYLPGFFFFFSFNLLVVS